MKLIRELKDRMALQRVDEEADLENILAMFDSYVYG